MLTRETIEAMRNDLEQNAAQLNEQLQKTLGALELCQHWLDELDREQKEAVTVTASDEQEFDD